MTSGTSDLASIDGLICDAKVILVVGPGGVGKTTLAAAMAARAAAKHGHKALVVTVDPARRLAEALGLSELAAEPVLVPLGSGAGRFWAQMIDMERSWDNLVSRLSPDAETSEALLANRLYRTLTRRFIQSHDYIALDQLVDLAETDRYDLVVVDTPPSVHVLDIVDAPDQMLEFFGSQLLRLLTAPYRNRMVTVAAKPFRFVADRLLGGAFVNQMADFFWLFSKLQPEFVKRSKLVNARLESSSTKLVVVHTPEESPTEMAEVLISELTGRGLEPSLRLVNGVLDPAIASLDEQDLASLDPALGEAMARLASQARSQERLLASLPTEPGLTCESIRWRGLPLGSVADLLALLDPPAETPDLDG